MHGIFVNTFARSQLDDVSQVHHGDSIGNVADYREIVGDEDIRKVELFLQVLHQVHNLGLNGYIQCADRLVGNDNLGICRQGSSDADTLALSTGKFMRVLSGVPAR